jgi:hypothetical protein
MYSGVARLAAVRRLSPAKNHDRALIKALLDRSREKMRALKVTMELFMISAGTLVSCCYCRCRKNVLCLRFEVYALTERMSESVLLSLKRYC